MEDTGKSSILKVEKVLKSFAHFLRNVGSYMEWLNPGSISYRRPDDPEKTAQYMVITDGNISMKCVEYDRSPLYQEALRQEEEGRMACTEIQDFMFFFGDAKSTREPLR